MLKEFKAGDYVIYTSQKVIDTIDEAIKKKIDSMVEEIYYESLTYCPSKPEANT